MPLVLTLKLIGIGLRTRRVSINATDHVTVLNTYLTAATSIQRFSSTYPAKSSSVRGRYVILFEPTLLFGFIAKPAFLLFVAKIWFRTKAQVQGPWSLVGSLSLSFFCSSLSFFCSSLSLFRSSQFIKTANTPKAFSADSLVLAAAPSCPKCRAQISQIRKVF